AGIHPFCTAALCVLHLQQTGIGKAHIHLVINFYTYYIMFFAGNAKGILVIGIQEITQDKSYAFLFGGIIEKLQRLAYPGSFPFWFHTQQFPYNKQCMLLSFFRSEEHTS